MWMTSLTPSLAIGLVGMVTRFGTILFPGFILSDYEVPDVLCLKYIRFS
jgi:hypothetical protein